MTPEQQKLIETPAQAYANSVWPSNESGNMQSKADFIAGIEYAVSNPSLFGVAGWVRASERLNKDDHEHVYLKGCRFHKGILRYEQWKNHPKPHIVLYANTGLGIEEITAWMLGNPEIEKIFWLDESLLPFYKDKEIERLRQNYKTILDWINDSGLKNVSLDDKKGMALYHIKHLSLEALNTKEANNGH